MNNENGKWRNVRWVLARGHNWIFVPSSASAQFESRHAQSALNLQKHSLQNNKAAPSIWKTSSLFLSRAHTCNSPS